MVCDWRRFLSDARATRLAMLAALLIGGLAPIGGCDALNPAFVEVMLPADFVEAGTTENPSGHVPIFFVSNARFDGELLSYLESQGVDVSDPNLRPRVRVRVVVVFADGSARVVEFIDGAQITQTSTTETVDGSTQDAIIPPDLDRPVLNNQVMQCDISLIGIIPEIIEVYVPVFIGEYTVEEIPDFGLETRLVQVFPPQFYPLQMDEVDLLGNTTTLRNIGIRDIPGPLEDLTCGSVVLFSLEGTLRVPFIGDSPGWIDEDAPTIAAFPGRFKVLTAVQ